MKGFASLRSLASSFFHRSRLDGEIEEELRSHLEHRADDLESSGLARREAERRARIEFGGYQRFKEESHEALGGQLIENLVQDIRFSFRGLSKSPGFALVAVITLALGIGANAVVFGMLNALILRPLNVPQAESLYTIERGQAPTESYPDYLDLGDRNHDFRGIVAYEMAPAGLAISGSTSPVWLYEASGNYFDILSIKPYLGRFFHASDEHGPNSAPYVVLSYAYWHSHFQSDPGVIGRVVQLNKYNYTILGVAPPQFRGTELFFAPDLWAPLVNQEQIEGFGTLNSRAARGMWLVGSLKPGVSAAEATADLNSIAASLARTYPKEDGSIRFALARPGLLGDMLGSPVRAFVAGLMFLAGLILLAACANLGGLFATRAADRSREIALRLALGSSRQRIMRRLLTEAILVSLAGGLAGLAGSVALLHGLSAWQPLPNIPINVSVDADARTYVVALLLALLSGLLFGIVPLRQVLRANPWQTIKGGPSGATVGRRFTLRDLLLTGQIAVCAVLVTAALVAVRGLVRSLDSNLGFDPQNAIQVNTDLDMARYSGERARVMQRRMLDAVANIPGVAAAGFSDRVPLNLGWGDSTVFVDSTTDYRSSNAAAEASSTTFRRDISAPRRPTVPRGQGILLERRPQTRPTSRRQSGVCALSLRFDGEMRWAPFQTLRRRADRGCRRGRGRQVHDAHRGSKTGLVPAHPAVAVERYLACSSVPISIRGRWRTSCNKPCAAWMRSTLHHQHLASRTGYCAFCPARRFPGPGSARWPRRHARGDRHLRDGGVLRQQRLRELGIRIALGAQRGEVLGAVLGRVFRLLAFGSAAGLLLGLAATKVLSFIVYQATPRDPAVLSGVVLTMLFLGLVAAWIPAQRALAADPLILLREE